MPDNFASRLHKNSSLIDVLIQVEDFLDGLDLYVFKNWFNGEIVEGPDIQRYWVSVTLKYPYREMPDPDGGLRLIKHGAVVTFSKTTQARLAQQSQSNIVEQAEAGDKIWLVKIRIPRKFIEELDDDDLSLYDQDVNTNVVSDARDENIDSSDAVKSNDNDDE